MTYTKEEYAKSYTEILEIFKYIPENLLKKIPNSIIKKYYENYTSQDIYKILSNRAG